jgi:diacylglycerol kinase (ATP)
MRPNSTHKPTGLKRLVLATGNSMRGFRGAWINEAAFRQECVLAAIVLPLGLWFGNTAVERLLLTLPALLLLVVELLNSAVEVAVDRIGVEHHPLSGLAKDLASAAVLLALGMLALAWGLILYERCPA